MLKDNYKMIVYIILLFIFDFVVLANVLLLGFIINLIIKKVVLKDE